MQSSPRRGARNHKVAVLTAAVAAGVVAALALAPSFIDRIAPMFDPGPDVPRGIVPGAFITPEGTEVPLFADDGAPRPFGVLDEGAAAYVASGPTMTGGRSWVRIQLPFKTEDGVFASVQTGTDANPAAKQIELAPCPGGSVTVGVIASLGPAERLKCFGARELVFPAAVLHRPADHSVAYIGSPKWLAEQAPLEMFGELGATGESEAVEVHTAPELPSVPLDTWVAVTGHFDDDVSRTCSRMPAVGGYPQTTREEAALWCSERFVVTRVVAVAAPTATTESRDP